MTTRLRLLLVVSLCVALFNGCETKPTRKCNGYYLDVRSHGFCDMGPNRARDLVIDF